MQIDCLHLCSLCDRKQLTQGGVALGSHKAQLLKGVDCLGLCCMLSRDAVSPESTFVKHVSSALFFYVWLVICL